LRDNQAKKVLDVLFERPQPAEQVISELWFDAPALDDWALQKIAQTIIDQNPSVVQQYKEWKTSTIGFFVWQMMQQTQWKADPNQAKALFVTMLS
jgi:aspartyl-tRNA(Asn)/glutamyl-tRNA(Gln) amidotransferase subunit B